VAEQVNQRYLYLLIDLGSLAVPLAATFHPRLQFHRTWRAFLPALAVTAACFLIWDAYFTSLGVWGFNPRYLTGVTVGNLPIEELLFFLCIPYACGFTYHCLKRLVHVDRLARAATPITWTLIGVISSCALINSGRMYTVWTFSLLSALLLLHLLVLRTQYLGTLYLAYVAILPFFFLTNGLLTGALIPEEVVWYNNAENLGVRLGTIPIEDSMYALLLMTMMITVYERLLER
jgi:lycopene cyclase domain-containing protein